MYSFIYKDFKYLNDDELKELVYWMPSTGIGVCDAQEELNRRLKIKNESPEID